MNDIQSLAHTSWNCKYHIVFAPKYRRKVFYEDKRLEIGKILRELYYSDNVPDTNSVSDTSSNATVEIQADFDQQYSGILLCIKGMSTE